jgi:cytochrome P450
VYTPGPLGGPAPLPFDDCYLVAGFSAARKVMANAQMFQQLPGLNSAVFGDQTFEEIDEPERHGEIRGVWSYEVQRDTLHEKWLQLVEEVVCEYADPLIDRVLAGETSDALDVHYAIPNTVMFHMMDLPLSDRDQLLAWAGQMGAEHVTDLFEQRPGVEQLRDYLEAVLVERRKDLAAGRRHPGSDLLSMMAGSEVAKTLSESEVVANCTQLVFAGAGTTATLMSVCAVLLSQHPDQRRRVVEDRSLIGPSIEEVLRFRGPAYALPPRMVAEGGGEIEGVRVPEGGVIGILLGAVNRDASRWEDPNRFDIFREPKQHLGFGFGMHFCFGANLARFQTAVYLERLLDRLPEWSVPLEIDFSKNPIYGAVSAPIHSIPIAAA